MLSAVTDWH